MNSYEFEKTIKEAVNSKPSIIYRRIQFLFPREFTKYEQGMETTDAAKQEMTAFLIRKGNGSGDYMEFLKKM